MGVFDTVMVPCPVCGHAEEFQSKGGMCILRTYGLEDAPDDVMSDVNRHSPCDCEKCGAVFSVDESARKAVLVSAAKPVAGSPGDSAAASIPAPYAARPGWDDYFAEMARLASSRSTCNSSKVGAVIVRDRRVIATGYNGSLSGKANCCAEPGRCVALESPGKKYDNCPAVHAEANAVAQAALCGLSIAGADIYVTRRPCLICAKLLAASGIDRIHIVGGGDGGMDWSIPATDLVDRLLELSPAHGVVPEVSADRIVCKHNGCDELVDMLKRCVEALCRDCPEPCAYMVAPSGEAGANPCPLISDALKVLAEV